MTEEWNTFIRFAADRQGVASRDETRRLGIDDTLVWAWLRRGRIERPAGQVYRAPGAPDDWLQRVRVAVATEGQQAVASYHTAAVLHGLDGFAVGTIHVTTPRWLRRKRHDVVVHETRVLESCDVTLIEGIPVTSLVRTLIDLAGWVHPRKVGVALDECVRTERTTYEAVYTRTCELSARGRRGIGVMKRLLAARGFGRPRERSPLERRFYDLVVGAGLPAPLLNHRVEVEGESFEIDMAWPAAKFGAEVQSERHHMDLEHFHRDPERMNKLKVIGGWNLLAWTSRRLEHPASVIAEVRAGLGLLAP